MKQKGFTLIELLLAISLLVILLSVAVFNFNSLSENAQYKEAKENLKTLIISHRHKAAYNQKTVEVDLNQITNELNIVDASKIVFFSDGSVEESYIIVSSLDGKYTNKLIINIIGYVSESSDFEIPEIKSEDRLPIENYEEAF